MENETQTALMGCFRLKLVTPDRCQRILKILALMHLAEPTMYQSTVDLILEINAELAKEDNKTA
jgi:hypothetical protein